MKGWQGRAAVRLTRLVLDTYGTDCHLCGSVGTATTADHLIPRSKGGAHSLANMRPACGPCNSARGDMDLAEWFKRHPKPSHRIAPSRAWFG